MYVVDTVTEMGRDLGRNKDKNLIGHLKCKYFINNNRQKSVINCNINIIFLN